MKKVLRLISLFLAGAALVWLLAPRGWEPTAESWKGWAAARVLRETGGFPVFTQGPLYVLYLNLFAWLPFPQSAMVEFLATRSLTWIAAFAMMSRFMPRMIALLLSVAWLPYLATLEGGRTLPGIAFVFLYFAWPQKEPRLISIRLLAAALCQSMFQWTFLGHAAGRCFQLLRERRLTVPRWSFTPKRTTACGVLAVLLALTVMSPSRLPGHNQMSLDPKWAPIEMSSSTDAIYFVFGNWMHSRRQPSETQFEHDWYLTQPAFFNGAKSMLEAFKLAPSVAGANAIENLKGLVGFLRLFLWGPVQSPAPKWITASSLLIWGWALWRARFRWALPSSFAWLLGIAGIAATLVLTFPSLRYGMALLPFACFLGFQLPRVAVGVVALIGSAGLFMHAPFPQGWAGQWHQIREGSGFLERSGGTSMTRVAPELLDRIRPGMRVLALEDAWIRAFSPVRLEDAFQVFRLPPFQSHPAHPGEAERTREFLDSMDLILVSHELKIREPSMSTQSYLRYDLHLRPFLENGGKIGSMKDTDLPGFGVAYLRSPEEGTR